MNKRKLAIILISILSLAIIAGVVYFLNQKFHFLADTNSSLELYGVSPNEKLIKGMSLTDNKNSYAVTIAKNEYEPFVVAVKNTSNLDLSVKLTMPTLAGYKLEFYQVKYVDFGYEGLYQRQQSEELYADPLAPIVDGGGITVPHNSEEYVWINVFAEKSATVGNKQVQINFDQAGIFTLGINQMTVSLPDKSTLSNIVNFDPQYALPAHGYNDETPVEKTSLIDKYIQDFSNHRASPTLYGGSNLSTLMPSEQVHWDFSIATEDPGLTVDFNNLNVDNLKNSTFKPYNIAPSFYNKDTKVLSIGKNPVPVVTPPATPPTIDCNDVANCPKFDLAIREYFSAWNQYLTEKGIIDDSIYYIGDELDTASGTNYDKVEHLASLVHQSAPKIKIALTLVTGDLTVIKPIVDKLTDVDIWIPHLSSVLYADPKNWLPADDELWVYDTSTVYRTDMTPEQFRLMPWMAYKYGATGNLYWSANRYLFAAPWYPKYINLYGSNIFYYPPSEDKSWVALVDGVHYINASVKDPTIVGSIRLEMIREGVEDYELMKILEAKSVTIANATQLLDSIKTTSSPLAYGNIYSYKISKLVTDGELVLDDHWKTTQCASSSPALCLYYNNEIAPGPGVATGAGTATISLDGIKPGDYKLTLGVFAYTDQWDASGLDKPIGSKFTLKINDGEVKNYDYYQTLVTDPSWLYRYLRQATVKNSTAALREIKSVKVGADGRLSLQFGSVDNARAVLSSLQLNQVPEDYGTATLITSVRDALIQANKPEIGSINITENQVITTNPYIISVAATDAAETLKISKVEFYIDNTLISTATLPDVSGTYQAVWDTSKYHSVVKVIVYGIDGTTQEITRNTTVELPQNYQSLIVNILPQTGEENILEKIKKFVIQLIK